MPWALFEVDEEAQLLDGRPSAVLSDHEVTCIRISIGVVASHARATLPDFNNGYDRIYEKLSGAWDRITSREKEFDKTCDPVRNS